MDAVKIIQLIVLLNQLVASAPALAEQVKKLISDIKATLSESDEAKLKEQLAELRESNDSKHEATIASLDALLAK